MRAGAAHCVPAPPTTGATWCPRPRLACAARRAAQLPAALKPAALTLLSNVLLSLPAHAEAGKIFDFNLTLPIMAGQFLLLMVFLDNFWFSPVGKLLDSRDGELRSKLTEVKDNGAEIARLQAEAEKVLSDARSKASKDVADAKARFSADAAKQLAAAKAKVDAELARSLATLETEKASALKDMDKQVRGEEQVAAARGGGGRGGAAHGAAAAPGEAAAGRGPSAGGRGAVYNGRGRVTPGSAALALQCAEHHRSPALTAGGQAGGGHPGPCAPRGRQGLRLWSCWREAIAPRAAVLCSRVE